MSQYVPHAIAAYLALCLIAFAYFFVRGYRSRRKALQRARATPPVTSAEHTLHLPDYARMAMVAERLEIRPTRREPHMSRRHIAAFTAAGSSYPDFVSINQEGEDRVSIATRTNNGQTHSTIVLPLAEFEQIAADIATWRARK